MSELSDVIEMRDSFIQVTPKPFLKWAGGKTQLLPEIERMLPADFAEQPEVTYIEPFVGGGAVLFHLLHKYQNITRAVINDINPHLIHAYQAIKENPDELIALLGEIQSDYRALASAEAQKSCFLEIRERFNHDRLSPLEDAAFMIFLNRTCFNGLYRENSKGEFNVAFGRYANPTILDEQTLRADSRLLQKVEILHGDFAQTEYYTEGYTFFYFDPPYRPISSTAAFTAYHKGNFNDAEQYRLKEFFSYISERGCHALLSNSDGSATDPGNTYLDELYGDFFIHRVQARRAISCVGSRRGSVGELLIRNYR